MRARRRQSGQLADHRSGTLVAERPDEQLAPKMPIYMAMRSRIEAERADTTFSIRFRRCSAWRVYGR
jgi:predicted component of type VI protein secretion system